MNFVLKTALIHTAKVTNFIDTWKNQTRRVVSIATLLLPKFQSENHKGPGSMQVFRAGSKACLIGSSLLFSIPTFAFGADLHKAHAVQNAGHYRAPTATVEVHPISSRNGAATRHAMYRQTAMGKGRLAHHAVYSNGGRWGISCVPYARQVSGITVAGNAWQWWENAAGQYARGDRPEPGSVLNFRANGRMPMGHVAVVSRVVNPREVIVDQANWPSAGMRGGVSHNVAVVDVSEANNWSAVRVELGHGGDFGSVYPTYGFIYNRADSGIVTASVALPMPQPVINPVPSDLRPAAERPWQTYEEVAESPIARTQRVDLQVDPSAAHVSR
jgi:surface antigen